MLPKRYTQGVMTGESEYLQIPGEGGAELPWALEASSRGLPMMCPGLGGRLTIPGHAELGTGIAIFPGLAGGRKGVDSHMGGTCRPTHVCAVFLGCVILCDGGSLCVSEHVARCAFCKCAHVC